MVMGIFEGIFMMRDGLYYMPGGSDVSTLSRELLLK